MSTFPDGFEAERAELASLLASGIFDRSPNLHRFLSFVCEKYFRGEGDEVKEYSVAVEALGRPTDFDQKRDSIVRVEAHRLRKRLDDYYRLEGAGREFRIVLPAGSYVPQFVRIGSMQVVPVAPRVRSLEERAPVRVMIGGPPLTPVVSDGVPLRSPWTGGAILRAGIAVGLSLLLVVSVLLWTELNRSNAETNPEKSVVAAAALPPGSPSLDAAGESGIRILAGSPLSSFVDRFGHTWTGDSYFTGGAAVETRLRTLHFTAVPELYNFRREGEFSYDIPAPPGNYELRLHFVEPIFGIDKLAGGGETSRLFNVELNGHEVLAGFDIVADAFGDDNTDVRVFRDVKPAADGKVHLRFTAGMHESPILSALELVPSHAGKLNAVRIVASDRGFYDGQGNLWQADNYVHGGRTVRRNPIDRAGIDGNLFASERYGNFTYMIPVAAGGKYRVRLHFCERWFGPGTHAGGAKGSRVFDVCGNGQLLLSNFDIFAEAGGTDIPLVREFSGLEPNAQGKLILQFVPRVNYALLNAIEVIDEGN